MKPVMRSAQRPLSDVYGRIEEILLSMSEANQAESIEQLYGGMFEALGGRVQFIILGEIENEQQREKRMTYYSNALRQEKYFPANQIIILEPDFDPEIRSDMAREWIQDPFSILTAEDGTPVFLEPYHFGKGDGNADQNIAEQVSANTGYLIKSTRYFFEGGNILVGCDYMLIGMDTLQQNLKHYYRNAMPETEEYEQAVHDITMEFGRIFGVHYVVWVGSDQLTEIQDACIVQGKHLRQPFFHLDLYISLGGKTKDGEERIFVADIEKTELDMIPNAAHRANWERAGRMLDEVAEALSNHHRRQVGPRFYVQRIPMGINVMGPGSCLPLSFNNCLTEVYENVQNVYLPVYKSSDEEEDTYLRELFERAATVYRQNGFRVVPVKGRFLELSEKYGSLHCITKVLKRRNYIW